MKIMGELVRRIKEGNIDERKVEHVCFKLVGINYVIHRRIVILVKVYSSVAQRKYCVLSMDYE